MLRSLLLLFTFLGRATGLGYHRRVSSRSRSLPLFASSPPQQHSSFPLSSPDAAAMNRRVALGAALSISLLPTVAGAADAVQTYRDTEFPVSFTVPASWEKKENVLGARRLIVFVNPNDANENAFIIFSPVQPDYTSLASFGNIDNVASTVLPPAADFPSEMLEMGSKNGNYYFDYTITAPGEPKRHLKTAFSLVPATCLITFTSQTTEARFADSSDSSAATLKANLGSYECKNPK